MHEHIYLDKKDGGNVTTQEIGTYLVYHYYLAESCQQAHFNNQRERERARETEKCVMLLPMKIRPPVWWHSYSKIMVCLLILNIKLKYDQDLNMHNLACTQGAVAVTIVKHNRTLNYQQTLCISNLSTNEAMLITDEVGDISCLQSCILSCRALLADSL